MKNQKIITKKEKVVELTQKPLDRKQLRYMIDRYYQVQKHRLAIGGQIRAMEESKDDTTALEGFSAQFSGLENDIAKYIGKEVKNHVMWEYLKETKGIGPILAAGLLATLDIDNTKHASSFWRYAGLDVAEDGRGRSRRKEHLTDQEYTDGEGKTKMKKGITFNPFLKSICWKIGESFIKVKGEHREIYDNARIYYDKKFKKEEKENKRTLYTKGHKFSMAKRKAVKRFLVDFWAEWMRAEGHIPSDSYAHRADGVMPQSIYNYNGEQFTCGKNYWEAKKGLIDPKKFSPEAIKAIKKIAKKTS